ncbi:hypothetical protein SCB49_07362 [unidentified eubacterium SCB49]|nr:hypothetical protein SCB49_07362 [unidentified eubacterium SCB49]
MGLHKIIKIIGLLLSVASVVFFVMILNTTDQVIADSFAMGEDVASVNWALYASYIMLALICAFVLLFVIKGIFSGDVKKTLFSVGGFLLIGAVSYALASNSLEGLPLNDGELITPSASKWVGAGIITFYILAAVAILAMIFSGVKKLANK